jgi:soluble lytic murein transglycosylase-like protein
MKKSTDTFKVLYVLLCLSIIICGKVLWDTKQSYQQNLLLQSNNIEDAPKCLKLYYLIEKYSDEYNVPKYVAYNVAYLETGYRGPFNWTYNPHQTSSVGALGPMQIMPSTADWIIKKKVPKSTLMNDLELNVSISMKLLNKLHKQYKDWAVVCGFYNTGYPIVNDYGAYCAKNKDYSSKWVSYGR